MQQCVQRQGRTRHLYYILIIYSAISVQVLVLPEAPARKVPGEVREEQSAPATTPRLYTSPTRHHELDISRGIPTLASM